MNNEDTKYCKWCDISKHMYDCPFGSDGTVCPTKSVYCLFRESAEFEARCMNNAIIYAYIKGVEVRTLSDYMPEIIKAARLKAEEQME